MANRRKKIKEKAFNIGNKIFPIVRELSGPLAFIEQISAKDRATLGSAWDTAPVMQKGKILANILLGRTTGIHLFKDEIQPPQTINIGNFINKWSTLGIQGMLYSFLGRGINKAANMNIVPHTGKIGSISKRIFAGGGFGGVFDDDPAKEGQKQTTGTYSFTQQTRTNQITISNNGFQSMDSSASGFE